MKREDRRHGGAPMRSACTRRHPAATPNLPKKPVHGWPAIRIALIRRPPVLSTRVNPTDGLRFSGVAARYAEGGAHPYLFAAGPRKELAHGHGATRHSRSPYVRRRAAEAGPVGRHAR